MTCFLMPDGTTVKKYCESHNIPYATVWRRLDKGQPIEQAIKPAVKEKRYYKGVEWSKYCGGHKSRKYCRVSNWMSYGMSFEDALQKEIERHGE